MKRQYIKRTNIPGISKHPLYRLWFCMRARCKNKKRAYFKRKISVCKEWENDFLPFYYYVSNLPKYNINIIGLGKDKLTLDRINNDGNYEPGNIRWATPKEQYINSIPYKIKRKEAPIY